MLFIKLALGEEWCIINVETANKIYIFVKTFNVFSLISFYDQWPTGISNIFSILCFPFQCIFMWNSIFLQKQLPTPIWQTLLWQGSFLLVFHKTRISLIHCTNHSSEFTVRDKERKKSMGPWVSQELCRNGRFHESDI